PPTTRISHFPLHDALPISHRRRTPRVVRREAGGTEGPPDLHRDAGSRPADVPAPARGDRGCPALQVDDLTGRTRGLARRIDRRRDRKSTRLNSSHEWTSYA